MTVSAERVLVTGGSGYLGQFLVQGLARAGCKACTPCLPCMCVTCKGHSAACTLPIIMTPLAGDFHAPQHRSSALWEPSAGLLGALCHQAYTMHACVAICWGRCSRFAMRTHRLTWRAARACTSALSLTAPSRQSSTQQPSPPRAPVRRTLRPPGQQDTSQLVCHSAAC
jgi:hypothetical protein